MCVGVSVSGFERVLLKVSTWFTNGDSSLNKRRKWWVEH